MAMMPTVLVVDDNPAIATAIEVLLSLHDIRTLSARGPAEALERLGREPVDCVIQDMNFSTDTTSGVEGAELFRAIRARHPDLPVILLTAWTHLETAVELIKAGAADYLAKPWDNQRLVTSVRNLIELGQASRELAGVRAAERARRDDLDEKFDLQGMVFADPLTERTVSLACQVARADMPILITGPNGAGKERIAAIIQANSAVRGGPFVTLNCGALPSELIEAELFGAEPGAYTGATRAREGKFEAADGGTLFLDEIGNLSAAAQMKLLRVLETGRFQRLGSNKEQQVKVRVVSATNADLPAMIRAGQFREDLYYRLDVIHIAVPPLADRPRDILPLAEHFLPAGKRLSAEAQAALLRHRWPGNVRELRNVMQRAALLGGDVIQPADVGLVEEPSVATATAAAAASVDGELDRETIEAALARAGGVVSQAASELGLSRQALYRRMERLGIGR
jgi:DNA-binding NtrC family response regulator